MDYPSVVKIFATTQEPDYNCPWQSQTPVASTGSGVLIEGGRILTGAHVVANATFLQVKRAGSADKVTAHVIALCHDADLALVVPKDPSFLVGMEPAEIGPLPQLRDRVSVVGYPVGGEELSITEGVVSRIEVQEYSHSQRNLLAITVDAAINEGNSGGPVFKDGTIAGLAFQVLHDAENIGEVVPAPLIRRFLDGIESGKPPVVPGLGIRTQRLENPVLRRHLGVSAKDTGVLITEVADDNSGAGVIELHDVLTSIDGLKVSNDGTVRYQGRYRTEFPVVLGDHHVGDRIPVEVLRRGKRKKLEIELMRYHMLVPLNQYRTHPTYYVRGGLVFQPLSRDFLRCWEDWWDRAPKEFLYEYYFGMPTTARREIVVISRVLADDVNVGYEECANLSVTHIDGVRPRDLRDFVTRFEQADGLVELGLSTGVRAVIDVAAARAADPGILERYRIGRRCSPDLEGLLAENPAAAAPTPPTEPGVAVARPRSAPRARAARRKR